MVLAAGWAAGLGPGAPSLHVATVEHGLRPEPPPRRRRSPPWRRPSACRTRPLPWLGPKPRTRIQERARAARYALLAEHARAVGASHVLTGHHADDQAETILMRLARGSGVAGLAGMRRETPLGDGVTLVRPLLERPKAQLVALCRDAGIAVIDDPSNRDPAYARARLRADAALLSKLGLDRVTLSKLARRAARADAALEAETNRIETLIGLHPDRTASTAMLAAHRDLEPEILLRLLRRAVARVAPAAGMLRLERLERLTDAVAAALREARPYRATLGGARVVLDPDAVLTVDPEPTRRRGVAARRRAAIVRACLD